MSRRKSFTVPLAMLVMILWGSLYPLVKEGYRRFAVRTDFFPDILAFCGLRFAVCGGLILFICLITKRSLKLSTKSEWISVLGVGLFSVILHYSFSYIGLTMTDSGKTALLKQLAVAFFIPLSFLFVKGERFKPSNILSAALCLAGIVVLNVGKLGFAFGLGEAMIVAASFCSVISNVVAKKSMTTVDPLAMAGYSQAFGGVILLLFGLSLGGRCHPVSGGSYLVFGYICAASIVSYCLWYTVVKKADLSLLFIIKFMEPMFAALIGALVLKENPFTASFLGAFALIIVAVLATKLEGKKASRT